MGLIKAVQSAMTAQLAPANIATQNSTLGLSTSATALRVLQQSGRRDAITAVQMTSAIGKAGELEQPQTNALASKAGKVTRSLHQLQALEKPFMQGMDSIAKSAELRSKMAKKAAETGQKVAVLDAQTQAAIGWSHQKAHAETNYYQSAYGGL